MRSRTHVGLWMFAPPFGPFDLVRCTCGVYDGPLIGGTERLGKARQCGLDEPRLEGHPFGLAAPSHTAVPATLCPPPRTAATSSCSWAKWTAATTSIVSEQSAMIAGRRSMRPFQTLRAAS